MKNGRALWLCRFAVLIHCLLLEDVGAALELPDLAANYFGFITRTIPAFW